MTGGRIQKIFKMTQNETALTVRVNRIGIYEISPLEVKEDNFQKCDFLQFDHRYGRKIIVRRILAVCSRARDNEGC